ncbi:MAG: P27 family phage terminase small subunit, partial [Desulfobacterales bacterium]
KDNGERVVAFGRWAGIVGAYNGLRARGIRTDRFKPLRADGLSDLEIPVQTVNVRLRHLSGSYVSVVIPNPRRWTSEILARSDGEMRIMAGFEFSGARWLELLIYANIQSVSFQDSPGGKDTLTIAGTRYITQQDPQSVELEGISRIQKKESGRYVVRCAYNFDVKPTDTVTLPNDDTFTIDLIRCALFQHDAYMDVEGQNMNFLDEQIRPPGHLSDESKKFFTDLCDEYGIDDRASCEILIKACEAKDRAESARSQIEKDGIMVEDRHGQLKNHPLITVERDARSAFVIAMKALRLDVQSGRKYQ